MNQPEYPSVKYVYVIDIDGTLADVAHRIAPLEQPCPHCDLDPIKTAVGRFEVHPVDGQWCHTCGNTGIKTPSISDWDAFFDPAKIIKDPFIKEAKRAIQRIAARMGDEADSQEEHMIYFLTARNESIRNVTHQWLKKTVLAILPPERCLLWMRPLHDSGHAVDYKKKRLTRLHQMFPEAAFFYVDDDSTLYPMYKSFRGQLIRAPKGWQKLYTAPPPPERT